MISCSLFCCLPFCFVCMRLYVFNFVLCILLCPSQSFSVALSVCVFLFLSVCWCEPFSISVLSVCALLCVCPSLSQSGFVGVCPSLSRSLLVSVYPSLSQSLSVRALLFLSLCRCVPFSFSVFVVVCCASFVVFVFLFCRDTSVLLFVVTHAPFSVCCVRLSPHYPRSSFSAFVVCVLPFQCRRAFSSASMCVRPVCH